MRKLLPLLLAMTLTGCLTGCGAGSVESGDVSASAFVVSGVASETPVTDKPVARDGAEIQTERPDLPTRIPPKDGTKINIHFGDVVIPGVLNNSKTAQALIKKLPLKQYVSRYSHDFCGVTEELPYEESEVHYGWLNGDIDYATDAPYFTILFQDEEQSERYGSQVNIGVIDCPLEKIANLHGDYTVLIELAE